MNKDNSKTLILFDVDGTLTPSRLPIDSEMSAILQELRQANYVLGIVGGSDIDKIAEQILPPHLRTTPNVDAIKNCVDSFDFLFAENGLVAYKNGKLLFKQSIVDFLGKTKAQQIVDFCTDYISKLDLPVRRDNIVEVRNGLINVCPIGRSCSQCERNEFAEFDKKHKIREKFIDACKKKFGKDSENSLDLIYSIGGQISFDVFPVGWDKTYCLDYCLDTDGNEFETIYFFGDKTAPGGNDHEIFNDNRTTGYTVDSPRATLRHLKKLFLPQQRADG